MESTVFCSFEHKLTPADVGKLAHLVGAVIPVPHRRHLISSAQLGLHQEGPAGGHGKQKRDYLTTRSLLRGMTVTVLRKVEGNQALLGIPVHGRTYTIRNPGPVHWEKGDRLVLLPPIPPTHGGTALSIGDWSLVLPLVVPQQLAVEINQRLLIIALLSLDRTAEETRAAVATLRVISFRGHSITLPDALTDGHMLLDMKNACIALSMIANLSSELVLGYVRRLALEDSSMLLTKCQEILTRREPARRGAGGEPQRAAHGLSPTEEMSRLSALFVMLRQLADVVSEQVSFVVCDIAPDNKSATCIFKG